MSTLRYWLVRLARRPVFRRLAAWGFTYMSFLLPVHRLFETTHWLVFEHPQPAYPLHLLIVSRQACPSLLDLPPSDPAALADLLVLVQRLVRERNLVESGYRLIVNGGPYQEIPQLHFHLVSGSPA